MHTGTQSKDGSRTDGFPARGVGERFPLPDGTALLYAVHCAMEMENRFLCFSCINFRYGETGKGCES